MTPSRTTAARDLAGVVLAAGAGTRLRPLTRIRPKALCPVGNTPLVDWALDRVGRHCDALVVNVHHHREQLEAHLSGRVHLSIEEHQPLGTAGALGALRDWLDGRDALVVNADAWHRDPLDALVSDWDGEHVRLLVVEDGDDADFEPGQRFAGASLMPWSAIRELSAEPSGLYEVCWAQRLEAGTLERVVSVAPFIDCGTPADYLAANMAASGGEPVVGEGARVEGELVRSVVWPGGVVAAGERLVDAVRVGASLTVCADGAVTGSLSPAGGRHAP